MALLLPPPSKAKPFQFAPLNSSKFKINPPNHARNHKNTPYFPPNTKLAPKCSKNRTFFKRVSPIVSSANASKPFQFAPFNSSKFKINPPNPTGNHKNTPHFSPNTKLAHKCSKNRTFSKRVSPIVSSANASTPVSGNEKGSRLGRILLSDVVVKRKRNVFRGREWNSLDLATIGVVMGMHLVCVFAPFAFNWGAIWVAVGLYFVTGLLGITLSYHRNLSHRSFKLPKLLEYVCLLWRVPSMLGSRVLPSTPLIA